MNSNPSSSIPSTLDAPPPGQGYDSSGQKELDQKLALLMGEMMEMKEEVLETKEEVLKMKEELLKIQLLLKELKITNFQAWTDPLRSIISSSVLEMSNELHKSPETRPDIIIPCTPGMLDEEKTSQTGPGEGY